MQKSYVYDFSCRAPNMYTIDDVNQTEMISYLSRYVGTVIFRLTVELNVHLAMWFVRISCQYIATMMGDDQKSVRLFHIEKYLLFNGFTGKQIFACASAYVWFGVRIFTLASALRGVDLIQWWLYALCFFLLITFIWRVSFSSVCFLNCILIWMR